MIYKEPQSYKAYHLFLIQNLCIHVGIGCQELAMVKNFYSIHKKIANTKKEFGSKPVYNKEFLRTKINVHNDEVADFYDKEMPNVDSNYTCLAVINLYSTLKKDDNYYSEVILKGCKYIKKKVVRHSHDNLSNFFSSDESDDCDEE